MEEISFNSQEPPPQFLVKEISDGSTDSSPPVPVPIIDISLLSSEDQLLAQGGASRCETF